MTPAEAGRPAQVPGTRAGDAALASVILFIALVEFLSARPGGVPILPALLSGTAAVVAGTAGALGQAGAVLLRRYRPRQAFALAGVVSVLLYVAAAVPPTYVWPVVAFAVARAPGRALLPLLAGWLALVAGFAAAGAGVFGDPATALGAAVGGGGVLGVMILAGALAGRYTRAAAERAERQRTAGEQARRAAALHAERARIAEEIGSGVLAGLGRLVELTRRWAPAGPGATAPAATEAELRDVRDRARSVLAAMRRVLGVLRSSEPQEHPPAPGPGGGPARRRPVLPLPDRAGLVVQAAVILVALPLAAVTVPPGLDPALAAPLRAMALPLDSPLGLLTVATQFVLVAWWRTAPAPALVLACVASVVSAGLGATNLVADCSWLVLLWGAAAYAPPWRSAVAIVVSTAVWVGGGVVFGYAYAAGGPGGLVLAGLGSVPVWIAGVLVRRHRRETERRHRERAAAGDREAVARERLRVARDLHDVVAHHVSAIAVQAGAARMVADPAARADAVAHVVESGRRVAEALPELAGLTPDPHGIVLDDTGLGAVVGPSREAGLPVAVSVDGEPVAPDGDADLFAQRIVTESLTNTLRHAGPSPTRVRIVHRPEDILVEVTDRGPVPGHRGDRHGSGLGLVGMRERVELLGGSLDAGPGGDGGWTVRAVLPRTPLLRADEVGAAPISSSAPIRTDPSDP
ncbi:sensor histidine kinase [Pseudonocardia sp. HH130630-07]|uniref:sensor histidine kinase n=1 Tax=Pseudonocardia sp. HH130630-07 TaxID=1690815 RepID=UPI000814CAC6|nr:histidine kinase [Pseudonocardia sp. HH130630-07]ANY09504.1 hypothetical protein AFB00_28350 [Pseudonocardia sp. HH130630-07]